MPPIRARAEHRRDKLHQGSASPGIGAADGGGNHHHTEADQDIPHPAPPWYGAAPSREGTSRNCCGTIRSSR